MLKTWPQLSKCLCVWVCARHCIMNFLLFHLNLTTWSARSSEHVCTCAHGCMYACMHSHMHIPRVRMIKLRMMIEVTPLWGDSPCPGSKDKPQQDGRMGKFTFRIKLHSHQNHSKMILRMVIFNSANPCNFVLSGSGVNYCCDLMISIKRCLVCISPIFFLRLNIFFMLPCLLPGDEKGISFAGRSWGLVAWWMWSYGRVAAWNTLSSAFFFRHSLAGQ